MSTIKRCPTCGEFKTTVWKTSDLPELGDLARRITALFDYRGDRTHGAYEEGSPQPITFGLAISRKAEYQEEAKPAPATRLTNLLWESFVEALGERFTGIECWWREYPTIVGWYSAESRSAHYGLWLTLCVELSEEKRRTMHEIPEGVAISYVPFGEEV